MNDTAVNHSDSIDDDIDEEDGYYTVPNSLQINIRTHDLGLASRFVEQLCLPLEDELSIEASQRSDERRLKEMKKNAPPLRKGRVDTGYPVFSGVVEENGKKMTVQKSVNRADLSCFLEDLRCEGEGNFVLVSAFARIENRPENKKRMLFRYIFNDGRAEHMPDPIVGERLQEYLQKYIFASAYIFENPDGNDTINLNDPQPKDRMRVYSFLRFANADENLIYPLPIMEAETKDRSYRFAAYYLPLKK